MPTTALDPTGNPTAATSGQQLDHGKLPKAKYILGHSPEEIRRLMSQAAILRPITERLLRAAGIGPGMRVLDIGCGAGDVSILAADLVGPTGSVVGIDRSPQAIAVARKQVSTGGFGNVEFKEVGLESFRDAAPFDGVIGRYVLVHQDDPVAFLRTAARFLRPGGIVAFHEVKFDGDVSSSPPVWRFDAIGHLIMSAFREAVPRRDAASRLIEHFSDAGLPLPKLFGEIPIDGGASSPFYSWLAETARSIQPQLVQMGILTNDGMAIDTLENSLRTAAVEARSQIEFPAQVCAWTRI